MAWAMKRRRRLNENELLKKHGKIKKKLKALLHRYKDVFSSEQCSVGQTALMEAKLRVEPGTKPVM